MKEEYKFAMGDIVCAPTGDVSKGEICGGQYERPKVMYPLPKNPPYYYVDFVLFGHHYQSWFAEKELELLKE